MSEELTSEGVEGMIAKAIRKFREGNDDGADARGNKIPWERFDAKNKALTAVLEELETLKGHVGTISKQHRAEMKALGETHGAEKLTMAGRHSEDITLLKAGFDGDGRAALRSSWDRMPEADRGKTPGEWWTGQMDAVKKHREDPKANTMPELPRTLQPYVPAAQAPDGKGGGGGNQAPASAGGGGLGVMVGRKVSPNQGPTAPDQHQDQVQKIGSAKTMAEVAAALGQPV